MTLSTLPIKSQLKQAASASFDSVQYRRRAIDILQQFVSFDAACFTLVDPDTMLSAGAVTDSAIEALHDKLIRNEYIDEDYNQYEWLAYEEQPAALLSQATGLNMERSIRYRSVLHPAAFEDEMRVVLRKGNACLGYLTLFRKQRDGRRFFLEEERRFILSIVDILASQLEAAHRQTGNAEDKGIKQRHYTDRSAPPDSSSEAGYIVLSDTMNVLSLNEEAENWLLWLRHHESNNGAHSSSLPAPLYAVCSRALSMGTIRKSNAKKGFAPKALVQIPGQPFLTIKANPLIRSGKANSGTATASTEQIQLIVCLERSQPTDKFALLSDLHGLTPRERDILVPLAQGCSNQQLADLLHLSPYTVQDHLKSIYAKTGVKGRGELIGKLLIS